MSRKDQPDLSPFARLTTGQSLGKSTILICDPCVDAGQQTPMINIQGDDLDAQTLTLTLNVEDMPRDLPGTREPLRWPLGALIEFGTGGAITKMAVDYVDGATLSVAASYLRVEAFVMQDRHSYNGGDMRTTYRVSAQVTGGFAESHVQRTIFTGDVDDHGESAVFDIPKFGKIATLSGCKRIRFWQDPKGDHCAGDFFASDHPSGIEVPNSGQYFSVFNESGVAMKTAVVFELAP